MTATATRPSTDPTTSHPVGSHALAGDGRRHRSARGFAAAHATVRGVPGLAPLMTTRAASPPERPTRIGWTAVLAWVLGTAAYLAAVFNRSTLGVAGIAAQQRFGIDGASLSLLAVVQLGVYAALQVPVGTVLDRLGSRRLLVVGGFTMALGEAVFATAPDFGLAVTGRVLVGAGDAMTFISVTRMTSLWFPGRRVALAVQLTGVAGALGGILATRPLIALLGGVGWSTAFGVVALATAGVAVAVAVLLPEPPPRRLHLRTIRPARVARRLSERVASVWREPGTRLGMWCHFTTAFPASAFGVLWGYPYLVQAQGFSPAAAGSMLIVLNLTTAAASPVVGQLVSVRARWRPVLALTVVGIGVTAWTVLLAWPGRAPAAVVAGAVVAIALGGPASMTGLDIARTSNRRELVGTATGLANIGGFTASLVTMLGIGLVLSAVQRGVLGLPALGEPGAFRLAFTVPYLLWAVGTAGIVRGRRRVLRRERLRATLTGDATPGTQAVPV